MLKKNLVIGAALAGALTLAPLTAAVAAPAPVESSRIVISAKTFANCTALSKVYKGGVAKVGVKGNTVSGKLKPFKVKPKFDNALYKANIKMDRDKDGIACEKG